MEDKKKFMAKAIELSINSANTIGGPFGSVIVKDNKIIAEGSNKVTSSNDPTAHGEIVAIREACKKLNTFDLSGCDIYTSCEPCPMCLSAIYWSRIDKIYYANTREDAEKIDFDDSFIYSFFINFNIKFFWYITYSGNFISRRRNSCNLTIRIPIHFFHC